MQEGFVTPDLQRLAECIHDAVHAEPGPVWALVQANPVDGPLRRVRKWDGCSRESDTHLLRPIHELSPSVVPKQGYGARAELPLDALSQFENVFIAGADTDACVLATALVLFDAGIRVAVRADLCLSSAGRGLHDSAVEIMRRQLGRSRVLLGGSVALPPG